MSKTIRVSDEVHYKIGLLGNKNDTYNDILERLLNEINEEFTDKQAEYYNHRIEKFESGDFSQTRKIIFE